MSDQLEAEVQEPVQTDVTEQAEAQTDQVSETVSDSGENHEKTTLFTPEQKATAEYAFKAREAKRENEELKRQLAEAQQPQSEGRPAVPELAEFPEPEEVKEHIEAANRAAIWDHSQKQQKEADYQAQITAQTQANETLQKQIQSYDESAKKHEVKAEDLRIAGAIVSNIGVSQPIFEAILADEDGPLITMHLAANPSDQIALNACSNIVSLGQVYADIKAKAAKLKPKQTEAPSPAEILDGNGAPPKQGGPPGATYE